MNLRLLLYMVLFIAFGLGGQDTYSQAADTTSAEIVKPRVEIGIGRLGYYGDIGRNFKNYNPLVGNIGGHFRIGAPLYYFLDFDAYALYGRLSMSETTGSRRLNFSSELKLMGAEVTYNFRNLLKPNSAIAPYVSVGIAGFEFLSKTDQYDANGNRYHYWNDGTIRNLPEGAPNAHEAIEIQRDYNYETDIRKTNADGFDEYPERSWAIPVGAGATLNLTDHLRLRLGAQMYFTFTNYIDGITEQSAPERVGSSKNDWFLYTNAGLSYNFDFVKKKRKKHDHVQMDTDLLAQSDEDQDGDGVNDFLDECPNTPMGVEVDERGCPVDSDNDGVPDYLDQEPNSIAGAYVDADGVTISDEYFLHSYLFWIDSVYDMSFLSSRIESADAPERVHRAKTDTRTYYVQVIGNDSMSNEMIETLLSIPDVQSREYEGKTIFLIGEYNKLHQAAERKISLEADGIDGIVVADENGKIIDLTEESASVIADLKRISKVDEQFSEELAEPTMDVVYRVQIGAFSKPLSRDVFAGVNELLVINGHDGLTRYVSGSFTNLEAAAQRKVNLLLEGFEGAFITAYRGGKRIGLAEAGAIVSGEYDSKQEIATPSFNVNLVKFRVQIAAYRDEVPTDMLDQFIELGEIKPMRGPDGATRYVYGEFDSYNEASKAKEAIASAQFKDAFVIGEFNGQIISAKEAIRILDEN